MAVSAELRQTLFAMKDHVVHCRPSGPAARVIHVLFNTEGLRSQLVRHETWQSLIESQYPIDGLCVVHIKCSFAEKDRVILLGDSECFAESVR